MMLHLKSWIGKMPGKFQLQKRNLLVYAYLEDGTSLNAEIAKRGYGHAYTKFPFKYMQEFRQYEREARIIKRGLWN